MEHKLSIQNWLFRYALTELFHGNRYEMAAQLEIDWRTISRAAVKPNDTVSTRILERLFRYCMKAGISIDEILSKYPAVQPCFNSCD